MLGQYASLNASAHWQTLLREDIANAANEANGIVLQGIAAGVSPTEIASRLRRYVQGADTFAALFHDVETDEGEFAKLDLRQLPRALRGAGRALDFNARRIAFSELHNARAEAEVQHFIHDPLVEAVQWRLAPDRGTQLLADECDLLAEVDFFDLGPGVYPVSRVPTLPHPFCRCERMPVARSWAERMDPKPLGVFDANAWQDDAADLGAEDMTASAWAATVRDALHSIRQGATLALLP